MTTTNASTINKPNSAARIVRRSGSANAAYFLGRHRDRWIAALASSALELDRAA